MKRKPLISLVRQVKHSDAKIIPRTSSELCEVQWNQRAMSFDKWLRLCSYIRYLFLFSLKKICNYFSFYHPPWVHAWFIQPSPENYNRPEKGTVSEQENTNPDNERDRKNYSLLFFSSALLSSVFAVLSCGKLFRLLLLQLEKLFLQFFRREFLRDAAEGNKFDIRTPCLDERCEMSREEIEQHFSNC